MPEIVTINETSVIVFVGVELLMIVRVPTTTQSGSSAASVVYRRQVVIRVPGPRAKVFNGFGPSVNNLCGHSNEHKA